ncbi:MAG: hypothetical protein KDG89_09200 [Geminicoccaceae bacterium]|nr:hypothetical protein [Geminicoccaceae bacterium]
MSGEEQDRREPITKKETPKERGVKNDVDETVDETFPASDAPPTNPGVTGDIGEKK